MKTLTIILFLFLILDSVHSKNEESIEITANTMEWNKKEGKAVASGNASAVKGETIIKANKIVAFLDENDSQKITKLLAIGNIKFTRNNQIAYGNEAIYYLDEEKIIINGNVKLKRNNNIMRGEKLIIDFITGLSKMESSKSNQKVKMKYNTD